MDEAEQLLGGYATLRHWRAPHEFSRGRSFVVPRLGESLTGRGSDRSWCDSDFAQVPPTKDSGIQRGRRRFNVLV